MSEGIPCPHALGIARVSAKRWSTRADLYDRLNQARKIMDQPSDQPPSLNDSAETASLSRHHFLRLFKHSFGATPGKYVAMRRIGIAQDYLRDSKLSISDIALKIGFQTPSAFTKAFRQATGMCPSSWRKAAREA